MAVRQIVMGAAAGVLGTAVLERATIWFYQMQDEQSRQREEAAREDYPPTVLAKQALKNAPGDQSEATASKLGRGIQWAMGLSGGVTYASLYRRFPLFGRMGGIPFGLLIWIIDDQVAKTVFRLAPPPQRFPVITHVRGLVGSLAYGIVISTVFKLLNSKFQSRKPWYRRTDWLPFGRS